MQSIYYPIDFPAGGLFFDIMCEGDTYPHIKRVLLSRKWGAQSDFLSSFVSATRDLDRFDIDLISSDNTINVALFFFCEEIFPAYATTDLQRMSDIIIAFHENLIFMLPPQKSIFKDNIDVVITATQKYVPLMHIEITKPESSIVKHLSSTRQAIKNQLNQLVFDRVPSQ